jgi:large subunit ribosomal protein L18
VRVRKKISGKRRSPRLAVFRSAKHIYAQIIDDVTGTTLVAASTVDEALKGKVGYSGNKDSRQSCGKLVGEKAKEKGITKVVFDQRRLPLSRHV